MSADDKRLINPFALHERPAAVWWAFRHSILCVVTDDIIPDEAQPGVHRWPRVEGAEVECWRQYAYAELEQVG